jgi:hypothetical protein
MLEFRALRANMYEFTRKLIFDTKDAPYDGQQIPRK